MENQPAAYAALPGWEAVGQTTGALSAVAVSVSDN
jgi:hypothetical protein